MQTLANEILADHSSEVKALSEALQKSVKETMFNMAVDSIFNIKQQVKTVKAKTQKIAKKLTEYKLVKSTQGMRDFYIVPKTTKGKTILDGLLLAQNPNRKIGGILEHGINSSPLGDKMRGFIKNQDEATKYLLSEGLTLA